MLAARHLWPYLREISRDFYVPACVPRDALAKKRARLGYFFKSLIYLKLSAEQ